GALKLGRLAESLDVGINAKRRANGLLPRAGFDMGLYLLPISALCTVASLVGLQLWTVVSLEKFNLDGSIAENVIHSGNASHVLDLLLGSHVTIALLANFVLNVFIFMILCLKAIFFVKLNQTESRKVLERLINYLVYKTCSNWGCSKYHYNIDFVLRWKGDVLGKSKPPFKIGRSLESENAETHIGAFLPLILPPTIFQAVTWTSWLTVLCTLKMFQALARDRLERLNASPSATPWTYFRVFSVLLFVLSIDVFWIRICMLIYRSLGSTMFLLLFFEPLSIAFETLQAIMVHGFQLLDMWLRHSAESNTSCERSHLFDKLAAGIESLPKCMYKKFWHNEELGVANVPAHANGIFCGKPLVRISFYSGFPVGSLWEWKGTLIRNVGFFLDIMTLLMALCHHFNVWWLHGMAFHLVDAVIFLNIRALGSAIIKRVRGFIKLTRALRTLHGALPDATSKELEAYDDECAICREPMAKAKKLSCNHLFHLACLRSWLDQGLSEIYSCPTCRRPLFASSESSPLPHPGEVLTDDQLAHQRGSGLDRTLSPGQGLPVGAFPDQIQTPSESMPWRGAGLDSRWTHPWTSQGLDGAGPSNAITSVGLGRVQMMMRQLASVGETYAQTALEDAPWSLWPMTHPPTVPGSSVPTPAATALRFTGRNGGLRFRNAPPSVNDNISNILSMADTVREVLPNIPDEIIFQELQRTNSVTVTVNNLLQM
ncbi:hypothetical protein IFM89_016553, partial [Coptis chinensis]